MSTNPLNTFQNHTRRWYDLQTMMAKSLKLALQLPEEARNLFGETIAKIAHNHHEQHQAMFSHRSLGATTVMGMHKGQQKRRIYDQSPGLFKMMRFHSMVPEEIQHVLNQHCIELAYSMHRYQSLCNLFNIPSQMDVFAMLCETYIRSGNEELERFMDLLHSKMELKYRQKIVGGSRLHGESSKI